MKSIHYQKKNTKKKLGSNNVQSTADDAVKFVVILLYAGLDDRQTLSCIIFFWARDNSESFVVARDSFKEFNASLHNQIRSIKITHLKKWPMRLFNYEATIDSKYITTCIGAVSGTKHI
jgi:hypothetical protein